MHEKKNPLLALSAAALALNSVSPAGQADPPDGNLTFDYMQSNYDEGDIPNDNIANGDPSRYQIDVHQLKVKFPLGSSSELSVKGVSETMTGSSPWYVIPVDGKPMQVMTGATIDESRQELGVNLRTYLGKPEFTLSTSFSTENDYDSLGIGISGALRLNNNLTTLGMGVSGSQDEINATDADQYLGRPIGETKQRVGGFISLSQVMTRHRLVGFTLGFSSQEGYLSDAYKLAWISDENRTVADSRPGNQNSVSLSINLRQYLSIFGGALHMDLIRYSNDWQLTSTTFTAGWYQNLGEGWQLIPSWRYYTQSAATFYRPYYRTTRVDGFYSSDYRLSKFTSSSARLKLVKRWDAFYTNLSYESYAASGDHPSLLEFQMLSLGVGVKF